MKRRFSVLLILLCVLFLTPSAISKRLTDGRLSDEFDVTGTTVSTSGQLSGHGATAWIVTGNASITGSAEPMDTGDVYLAKMWLEASGKDSSGVPGRGNVSEKIGPDGVEYRTSTGAIFFKSHNVGSASRWQLLPNTYTANQLSGSVSHSYSVSSYSSPTGLSVSPSCAATQRPLPCGHNWGTPGYHVLYSRCYTDINCISTNFYLCQHTEHEYAEVSVCEHTPGHGQTTWSACGHVDYLCKARDHTTDLCPPRDADQSYCNPFGTF